MIWTRKLKLLMNWKNKASIKSRLFLYFAGPTAQPRMRLPRGDT